MTEVSVYKLTATPLGKALPKLLEKVLESGKRAVVFGKTTATIDMLNEALWTYTTNYFLPHGTKADGNEKEQPIYLTTVEENPNGASILVVVEGAMPEFVDSFERCLDMYDGTKLEEVEAANERLKRYSDQKRLLSVFQQSAKGGWEKQLLA